MARIAGRLRTLLGVGLLTRILIDTGTQMFFPFLPIIAEGLGLTAVVLGRLLSFRSLTGLFAPLTTPLVQQRGYRFVLRLGLFVAGLGYLLIGLNLNLGLILVGLILAGLGSYTFIPALQAYLSTYLPYDRRARGLGIVELGWALSGIFGLFLVGEIIARYTWRTPFFIIGGGLLIAGLLYSPLPAARDGQQAGVKQGSDQRGKSWRELTQLGEHSQSAWAAIVADGLVIFAALHTFISYGSWLNDAFGLGPAALGRVALLLGLADLTGASLVTVASDRIGKRRGFLIGAAVGVVAFAVLPILGGRTLVPALAGLLAARFAFEFTLVGLIPLLSEQAPDQRNKVLALATASGLLGGAMAGWTGPLAYARGGLPGLALPSALLMAAAWVLVAARVREA